MRCFCRHCCNVSKVYQPKLSIFTSCFWVLPAVSFYISLKLFLTINCLKLLTVIFVSWTFLICTNVLFSTHTPHTALRPIVLLFCQHVIVNNTRAKNFCKQSSPFHSGRWLEGCQRGLVHFVRKRMA